MPRSIFFRFAFEKKETFVYLQKIKKKGLDMGATVLTPTQQHLLMLFSFNREESYAREIKEVLTRHFQSQLDIEADRLWDEGILDQKRLDELLHEDLHKKD